MIGQSTRLRNHKPPRRFRTDPIPPPVQNPVHGYGPLPAPSRVAIVGEGPGTDEDQAGVPFIGRSGDELDRFLFTHYIDPDECYITNVGRIFHPGNPDPTESEIAEWEWLLHVELNQARPWWIVAVGRISTRYFLGDVDMEAVHGIPFLITAPWLDNGRGGRCVAIPCYHPAAGFYSTEVQALIAYDFAQVALTVRGELEPRLELGDDRYPNPDYRDLTDAQTDINFIHDQFSAGMDCAAPAVAIDTEGLPGKPWGLSFAFKPGTGYVIRKVHQRALHYFFESIQECDQYHLTSVLHNSLHDLRVLRELGKDLRDLAFVDTMVLAYHLCIEPQGLKPLAFRHAGMLMQSYPEIVQEAGDRIALEYYQLMARSQFPVIEPYEILKRDKVTKQLVVKVKKPQQVAARVKRAFDDLARQPHEHNYIDLAGLRKRWDGTDELVVQVVEDAIGPMREPDLDDVPLQQAVRYAARDADATTRVYPALLAKHRAMGLTRVGTIDHGVIPIADEMQANGLPVDLAYMYWLREDLTVRMRRIQDGIKQQFGVYINPDSGNQVAELLFRPVEDGGYGLIPSMMTKGGKDPNAKGYKPPRGSTQDKVLEGLFGKHDIIQPILDFRECSKGNSSFVKVTIRLADPVDFCLRGNIRITRVSSGRFSMTKPNLMAFPVRSELGLEIRRGFVAPPGEFIYGWDLDQVEMRVMADESGDENLCAMFWSGKDIHSETAAKMFFITIAQVHKMYHRYPAKRTGFGVITGIQSMGLVNQMRLVRMLPTVVAGHIARRDNISREQAAAIVDRLPNDHIEDLAKLECANWINSWFQQYPRVPEYMEKSHREARAYGYVRDKAGRIRYLPGIHSPIKSVRAEAGRQSHSHKIQGGAQEILKEGMVTIKRDVIPKWQKYGYQLKWRLQVHDEVLLSGSDRIVSEGAYAELNADVTAALIGAAPDGFKVPLGAAGFYAAKWGDVEK